MNIDFDPTTMDPAHLRAMSTFLLALAGDVPVMVPMRTVTETVGPVSRTVTEPAAGTMGAERRSEILADRRADAVVDPVRQPGGPASLTMRGCGAATLSDAQVDSTDEMAGLTHTNAPSAAPFAPSTAAADMFPTVPAVPQAGAAPAVPVPPPPVPVVPQPPAPPAATPRAENGDLDKTGLPWDHRIHAGSKAKVADGTWRQRRNLPEGEYARIEAELRHLMTLPAGSAPVSAVPLPPTATTAVAQDAFTEATPNSGSAPPVPAPAVPSPPVPAAPVSAVPLPPAPPAASTTPPVPTPAAAAVDSANVEPRAGVFAKLMTTVTRNVTSGVLPKPAVYDVLVKHGVPRDGIGTLANNPQVAELVLRELEVLPGVEVTT